MAVAAYTNGRRTLTLTQLLIKLRMALGEVIADTPIRLVVGGIAYSVDDVWIEPNQEGSGASAVCIGEDPR